MLRTVQAIVTHLEKFPATRAIAACRRAQHFAPARLGRRRHRYIQDLACGGDRLALRRVDRACAAANTAATIRGSSRARASSGGTRQNRVPERHREEPVSERGLLVLPVTIARADILVRAALVRGTAAARVVAPVRGAVPATPVVNTRAARRVAALVAGATRRSRGFVAALVAGAIAR
jgi:hypothetical protein